MMEVKPWASASWQYFSSTLGANCSIDAAYPRPPITLSPCATRRYLSKEVPLRTHDEITPCSRRGHQRGLVAPDDGDRACRQLVHHQFGRGGQLIRNREDGR